MCLSLLPLGGVVIAAGVFIADTVSAGSWCVCVCMRACVRAHLASCVVALVPVGDWVTCRRCLPPLLLLLLLAWLSFAVDAAVAAYAMFLMGLLVVFGCLLGIFGKAIESVTMLRVFSGLVLCLALLFFGFSVATFAQVGVFGWAGIVHACCGSLSIVVQLQVVVVALS